VAKSKAAVFKQRQTPSAAAPRPEPAAPAASAAQLDFVLDKISRQGLDSLTLDERRVLEDMSRRLRRE
jgi:hypothetical protein